MIPFSAWQGLVVIIAVIFLVFPWKKWGVARWVLLISIVCLAALHIYPPQSLSGWDICLQRTVVPETLKTPCESSAQFRDGSTTFKVSKIDWDEDFIPVYFMNDKQAFNFYKDTEPDRKHLSYAFWAIAMAQGGEGRELSASTTIPSVAIAIDGNLSQLTPNNPLRIPLSEDRPYAIEVRYAHVRTSHDALSIAVPLVKTWPGILYTVLYGIIFVALSISLVYHAWDSIRDWDVSEYRTLLFLVVPLLFLFIQEEIWQWVVFLAFLGLWYLRSSSKDQKTILVPALLFLGFHTARNILTSQPFEDVFLPYAAGFLTYLLLIGFYGVHVMQKYGKKILPWIFALLLINAFAYTQHVNPYGKLVLFTGGDDELTHEGFARESLLSTSWKTSLIAGENYTFYYQPFFRYGVALIHAFWGESMFGLYVIQTFLVSVGFMSLLYAISLLKIPWSPIFFSLVFAIANVLPSQSLLSVTQRAFQQGLGTPLLFISVACILYMVLKKYSLRFAMSAGLILGLMISIRTDYVPVVPLAFLVFAWSMWRMSDWKKRILYVLSFCIAFAVFPAFIVLRNIYIDGSYAFMPTSGLYNLTDPYGSLFAGKNLKEIGSGSALIAILSSYSGKMGELVALLWDQLAKEFISTLPIRMIVWYGGFAAFFLGIIRTSTLQKRIAIIVLFFAMTGLLFPALFFVPHNGIAMRAQYDVLLMAMLAIGIGSLFMKPTVAKTLEL